MIEVKGVPDGYSAHIVTGALSVTVFGSHDQLKAISPDDLKLYIDLSTVDPTQRQLQALVSSADTGAFKRIDIAPIAVDVAIISMAGNEIVPEIAPEVVVTTKPAVEAEDKKTGGSE
jgi:hypothetical protein